MNNNQVKVLYSDVSNSVPSCASLQEKNSGGGWRLYPILSYALAIGGTSKTSNDNIARNGREKIGGTSKTSNNNIARNGREKVYQCLQF